MHTSLNRKKEKKNKNTENTIPTIPHYPLRLNVLQNYITIIISMRNCLLLSLLFLHLLILPTSYGCHLIPVFPHLSIFTSACPLLPLHVSVTFIWLSKRGWNITAIARIAALHTTSFVFLQKKENKFPCIDLFSFSRKNTITQYVKDRHITSCLCLVHKNPLSSPEQPKYHLF